MLVIDGSEGEGGGQILRTALALSLRTGTPFNIERIRARRSKPGLRRQHLTAVRAAAEVGGARIEGAEVGSTELFFEPGKVKPGGYRFDVGSAGSTTLVLQTVLPALIQAREPTDLTIEGGTHNPHAPPYEFIAQCYLPLVARMGPQFRCELIRPGFYPAGGGKFKIRISPVRRLSRLDILDRGPIQRWHAKATVALLDRSIAERELRVLGSELSLPANSMEIEEIGESRCPGNYVSLEVKSDNLTEVFTGFGQKGVPAETVAQKLVTEVRSYLEADVPVDPYLADQLVLPMALAGGGSFKTVEPTSHLMTNIRMIRKFIDILIEVERVAERQWTVNIGQTPVTVSQ